MPDQDALRPHAPHPHHAQGGKAIVAQHSVRVSSTLHAHTHSRLSTLAHTPAQGGKAIIAQYTVRVANAGRDELWGRPRGVFSNCSVPRCFVEDRGSTGIGTKFWGFVAGAACGLACGMGGPACAVLVWPEGHLQSAAVCFVNLGWATARDAAQDEVPRMIPMDFARFARVAAPPPPPVPVHAHICLRPTCWDLGDAWGHLGPP